jgi:hypothetical protein
MMVIRKTNFTCLPPSNSEERRYVQDHLDLVHQWKQRLQDARAEGIFTLSSAI